MPGITIFSNNAGQVSVVEARGLPALIGINVRGRSPFGNFFTMRSIVTRLMFSQQPNVQLLHTVGGAVHIYVFGDRIGSVSISGLAFGAFCDGGQKLGIEYVKEWYEENKASASATPVSVTVGSTPLRGYLLGMTADVSDPRINIWQFGLNLALIPKRPAWAQNDAGPQPGAGAEDPGGNPTPIAGGPNNGNYPGAGFAPGDPVYVRPTALNMDRGGAGMAPNSASIAPSETRAAFGTGPVTTLTRGFNLAP